MLKAEIIESIIIASIIHIPSFNTVVLPHAREEYFRDDANRTMFAMLSNYIGKYDLPPTKEAAEVELQNTVGLSEEVFQQVFELTEKFYTVEMSNSMAKQDIHWMLSRTEKYFKDTACYNAVLESLGIIDGSDAGNKTIDSLPDILKQAVSINFNTDVGHDYLVDWEARYEIYHAPKTKIPFSLYMLNQVTDGGYEPATLNLVIAGTGTGKTIVMCNEAGHLLMNGKDVLYITLEMAPSKISERIDAKLMQKTIKQVKTIDKEAFGRNISAIRSRTTGKLIVHQFPPRTITVRHIESLLNDLKLQKNFTPDVIFVDYLTLMNSYTYKGNSDNLYILGKLVAEELRGLAIRLNTAIFSASQTNRNGQNNADFDLNELGESHAISQTADFMFGIISTPELELLGHWRLKLLKSRYGSITDPSSFIVGVTKPLMTVFDVDTREEVQPNQALGHDATEKPKNKFVF